MKNPEAMEARAQAAIELMLVDRSAAAAEAILLLDADCDSQAVDSMAHRVLASVAMHRGRLDEAATHAALSVAAAEASGEDRVLGGALLTRMGVFTLTGRADEAIHDSSRAEPLVEPNARVRVLIQRATVLGISLGRVDEAIELYDRIEDEFPTLAAVEEAVLTMNRGTQLIARGEHARALADFARARERYRELGNTEAECEVLLHQARAAARIGDFPAVFDLHHEVQERNLWASSDHRTANDLAAALLAAGLRNEAETWSRHALTIAPAALTTTATAESALRLAEVRAAVGDHKAASALADEVAVWAAAVGNPGVRLNAALVRARADLRVGLLRDVRPLVDLAEEAEVLGRVEEAHDLRVDAAAVLAARGLLAGIREAVDPVCARGVDGETHAPQIARWRHARALQLLAEGKHGAAMREAGRGLDAIDRMRAGIAAIDLRATTVGRAPDLAALGVALATAARRPRTVLRWLERQRAVALRLTAAVSQPGSSEGLDALRRLEARPSEAEAAVTRQTRARRQEPVDLRRPSTAAIVDRVGDRALIEFFENGEWVDALVIHCGRVRHHRAITRLDEMRSGVQRLRFALSRMNLGDGVRSSAAADAVEGMLARLEPLTALVPDSAGEIVVVPCGHLHLLPWAALPPWFGRPVTVAPGAAMWSHGFDRVTGDRPLALLHGPGLPESKAELVGIAAVYRSKVQPRTACVDDALEAFRTARVVHLAAHGTFREDSPMFSSLALDDGPLYVHDLDRLARLPATVVLSACDLGSVDILRGDEVLGFPAALLARGVASVIAALGPVEDTAARDLMVSLHRHLADGLLPARALASASMEVRGTSAAHRVAASCFQLFGRRVAVR